MKTRMSKFAVGGLLMLIGVSATYAQSISIGSSYFLLPANPNSADNLRLSLPDPLGTQSCGISYIANPYRVSMSQNNLTVTLGDRQSLLVPTCPPPAVPNKRQEIDLGRLPAGDYTLTLSETQPTTPAFMFANFPFTVADARATKAAPYVRLDYSGSWWDPADPGWGIFIWQGANRAEDSLLVAWFTYTPDGKPMWYVTQPGWTSATATATAQLSQVNRIPGLSSPPPTTGTSVSVGTASLDFTNTGTADTGKITYTFTGGATLTRNIQRFRP
jgi:hypothetical protein